MDLKKLFGYEGKNVVITGAASGMSHAATKLLIELGANVYAIDINPIDLPVSESFQADLSDKDAIDNLLEKLPNKIDALFLCHGIAAFPGNELKVQKVNFYSQKYMTEKFWWRRDRRQCRGRTVILSTFFLRKSMWVR